MEKNGVDSDIEEPRPETEQIVETVPLPKPKRKITLSEEERKRRGDNLRNIVARRKAENDKVNEVIVEDVKAIKKQATEKVRRLKKEKAIALSHADSDSDSDSSVELPSSKKKRKSKQPTIIIKNYTLPSREHKSEFDASKHIEELQKVYKSQSEPVIEPPRRTLGYFV
jgi:Ni,Fe-hydrogenase I large subunit